MKLFKKMELTFDSFDNTIKQYFTKVFNNLGLEYTHTQIFGMIFDGIKGIMENMLFYIEDALTEQNIYKASRKQSVYSLAKISGYEPHYGNAASGIVIGKLIQGYNRAISSTKIYVPNHIKLMNHSTGVVYSIVMPTNFYVFDISKPLISHEFRIVQGTFMTSNYISKGLSMETVHISTASQFDREYLEVKVNGETWNEVGNIYDMTEDGHEYILSVGYDNTFDIIFGTGIYGKRLDEGDTVTIDYLIHSGVIGNITSNSTYNFQFSDKGYNALGDTVDINDYMTFTMENCISGGTSADSINFIKTMVGSNSRSSVLVSEDNFKLFFKRFSFIGYMNCWIEPNSMYVNITCLSNFKDKIVNNEDYFNINTNKMLLDTYQKEMIINTLNNSNKSFAGITVRFVDPIIRKYAFICYVKADNIYNKELITTRIRNFLAEYFINIKDGTLFIAKSDIISMLTNKIENMQSIDIDIISEYGENAYFNKSYTKYELKYVNNVYKYVEVQMAYENKVYPGLDTYGNIVLDSNMEIPVLCGNFKYYINKSNKLNEDDSSSIMIPAVQIYFI